MTEERRKQKGGAEKRKEKLANEYRHCRCTEDLQQRTPPHEYSTMDEASNEEKQKLLRRRAKAVTKPARGIKFNYACSEKFAWLYYDEEKAKPSASTA